MHHRSLLVPLLLLATVRVAHAYSYDIDSYYKDDDYKDDEGKYQDFEAYHYEDYDYDVCVNPSCILTEELGTAGNCSNFADDGECDASCNCEQCGWDGSDCFHDDECALGVR